jgi:hypothetical protein
MWKLPLFAAVWRRLFRPLPRTPVPVLSDDFKPTLPAVLHLEGPARRPASCGNRGC